MGDLADGAYQGLSEGHKMKLKPMSEWKDDLSGVSPVIAVILMVAITVVLAAVVYTWASGLAETGGGGGTPASCSQGEGNFLQMQSDPPRQTARDEPEYRMTATNGTVTLGNDTADDNLFGYSWSPGNADDDITGGDSVSISEPTGNGNGWMNGDQFEFAIRDNQGALAQCSFTWEA